MEDRRGHPKSPSATFVFYAHVKSAHHWCAHFVSHSTYFWVASCPVLTGGVSRPRDDHGEANLTTGRINGQLLRMHAVLQALY